MIWKHEFRKINFQVEQSVKELYDLLSKTDEYITFLSFGDYIEEYSDKQPYVIDNRIDGFKDEAWLKVLMTFLNSAYSFSAENTTDSKVSIFFETMMYIHVWESKPYLKHLMRIATLIDKEEYLWKLEIKDTKKSMFLEHKILSIFNKKNLKVSEIIKKGYVKQIRDAIAHNDYWHNIGSPEIILENYKKNPRRIEKLHFNEWTEYFCYTFLLAYHLRNYFQISKQNLDDEKCKNGFKVKFKNKKGDDIEGLIYYNKENDSFSSNSFR